MKLYDLETWEDVEALIRGLLPPESAVETITYYWAGMSQEEFDWLKRVETMRASLDNAPDAATAIQRA